MLVCAFFVQPCTRDRGCSAHPAFPAPSTVEGQRNENLGSIMPRERGSASSQVLEIDPKQYPRRPGQAKRDPGSITTNAHCRTGWGHRPSPLTAVVMVPAAGTTNIGLIARVSHNSRTTHDISSVATSLSHGQAESSDRGFSLLDDRDELLLSITRARRSRHAPCETPTSIAVPSLV